MRGTDSVLDELLDAWPFVVAVLGSLALLAGFVGWLVVAGHREHSRFVDDCIASGRHDRWECEALFGQSQGSAPVIVPVTAK